jgi:hypothetical protein
VGLARRKKVGVLEASDAFAVMAANRLGYEILTGNDGSVWYRKSSGICIGPFQSVKAAVRGAINEYDRLMREEFFNHAESYDRGG